MSEEFTFSFFSSLLFPNCELLNFSQFLTVDSRHDSVVREVSFIITSRLQTKITHSKIALKQQL